MITILFKDNDEPLYVQIYAFLKNEIIDGNLLHKEKLPSKRKLASHLSVSVNTVDAAYSQLVAEGYVESIPKKGYFICQIDEYLHGNYSSIHKEVPHKTSDTLKVDFSPTDIDHNLFPFDTFRKIFKSAYNEYDSSLLKKPNAQGDIRLRQALVELLYRSRGVRCSEEQIIIGAGTDNLLQTLSLLLGRDKCIAFENPVYLKAYKIFENMGNEVVLIDIDEKGIRLELLNISSNNAVYITPSHHFPLGISMPIDRRIQLLNLANKSNDVYIIEDDYDSEFRYNEKPLPSLQSIDKNGRVIYIGTFSKSIAPSIRMSYMVLPTPLLKIYSEKCSDVSSSVSVLEQKMIAEFIQTGGFERHINKMRKVYKEKRKFLINAFCKLGSHVKVMGENAGHHLLIKLKTGMTEEKMCQSALGLGVKVYPISPYFVNGITPEFQNTVLIGYASLTQECIQNGVDLIRQAWAL